MNIRTRSREDKLTGFPKDDIKCFVRRFLDFHFNSNKRITGANQNSRLSTQQHKFNSQNCWMNDLQSTFLIIITGSRGDVLVVRTSKPVANLWKMVILIALQFRFTFYRPQTKRLRARKIGFFSRHFVSRSPFGRIAVRQRGSGSDKKRRNRLQ